jgi:hypothetical protein
MSISEALRKVHSVATSITGPGHVETVTPGSILPPSVNVKEDAADKTFPFVFPEGKHIIVRRARLSFNAEWL